MYLYYLEKCNCKACANELQYVMNLSEEYSAKDKRIFKGI